MILPTNHLGEFLLAFNVVDCGLNAVIFFVNDGSAALAVTVVSHCEGPFLLSQDDCVRSTACNTCDWGFDWHFDGNRFYQQLQRMVLSNSMITWSKIYFLAYKVIR